MRLFSNEIVFRGHPDKVCDQISDALLDAYIKQDPYTRAGIEVVGGKGRIFVTGEVTSLGSINVEEVVKRVLRDVSYDASKYEIIDNIGKQSPDIAMGVDVGGAGDQGMMFGYACNETNLLLPKAMVILQEFSREYDVLRKIYRGDFFPDGKAQITGYYDENFNLIKIKTFTISYQNTERDRVITDHIVKSIALSICRKYKVEVENFLINPTGKFLVGGFEGDAGLTGRKIVVDTYHSFAKVGGGAFSGKDYTKVDRSAAYKARQLACEALTELDLSWCQVQLSYAIGRCEPLAIYIDSNKGFIEPYEGMYKECEPLTIIKDLDLRKPIYEETAKFGHFGDRDFSWEVR
jgi:S-adenosylmethionine synthetase